MPHYCVRPRSGRLPPAGAPLAMRMPKAVSFVHRASVERPPRSSAAPQSCRAIVSDRDRVACRPLARRWREWRIPASPQDWFSSPASIRIRRLRLRCSAPDRPLSDLCPTAVRPPPAWRRFPTAVRPPVLWRRFATAVRPLVERSTAVANRRHDSEPRSRTTERVRIAVENLAIPHRRSNSRGILTISAGVATYTPNTSATPDTVLEQADRALYVAKHQGRNRVAAPQPARVPSKIAQQRGRP